MAERKLSDTDLRDYLRMGFSQQEIADLFRITPASVSERCAKLETGAVAHSQAVAVKAVASVWDSRAATEENYQRALANYETAKNKTAAIGEIRAHIKMGLDIILDLYRVEQVQAFQDEVLAILDEYDDTARQRILDRIRERRSLRGAFPPNPTALSPPER